MGFLFYANLVRFVLEGGYRHILFERAITIIKNSGVTEWTH